MLTSLAGWSLRPGPLHRRLAEALRGAIDRGEIVPGTRLPAERALARMLAVSRGTVVAAYAALRREGIVESRQGSGTYVVRRGEADRRPAGPLPAGRIRRSLGVAALVAGADGAIDLTAATVPADGLLSDEVVAAALADPQVARGNGYAPLGITSLRRAIAAHLSSEGLATAEEQVLVTSGAQQAIGLVASLLCGRGDHVAIESPSFPGAIDVLAGLGARAVPIPVGQGGARVDVLREAALDLPLRLVYLIPTYQNPTGTVLPEDARREVARLAGDLDLPVIDDRTTAELVVEGTPPPPIGAFAPDAPVLTIGSMSKLFWGGLRIGWVRASEPLVARLAQLKVVADLSSSAVSQALAAVLLPRASKVRAMRRRQIAAASSLLARLLGEQLPDWSWTMPSGGLTLWAKLPRGDAEELAQVALRHGVVVLPGPTASPEYEHRDFVRLPLLREPEVLEEGIGRLAAAWRSYEPGAVPAPRTVLSVVV